MGIEQIGNDGLLARFEQLNQNMRVMNQNARTINAAFHNELAASVNQLNQVHNLNQVNRLQTTSQVNQGQQINFMSGQSAALALRDSVGNNTNANTAASLTGQAHQAAGVEDPVYNPVPAEKAGETVGEFKQLLTNAFENVNTLQNVADEMTQRYDVGDRSLSLADVMLATQKSSLSFEATLQIRNRLVDAYQSIMQMQI